MKERGKNQVRERREALGLAQIALAERVHLTRQGLGAIEAGRATPAVDVALRLARALDCPVEELFSSSDEVPRLEVELMSDAPTGRLALACVQGRWVGFSLAGDRWGTAADALVVSADGRRGSVAPLRPLDESRENVALMGCAVGLGLIADGLRSRRGAGRFHWLPCSSDAALRALVRGATHLAGVHSVSDRELDGNVQAVRQARPTEALVLITLARWEAGLLSRRDDLRVRNVADLGHPELRLVVREKGAGARQLLEERLRQAGLPSTIAGHASLVAAGHLDVARAISMNAADVGVATRDAALAFGLRFLPLAEERYDLVIPRGLLADARIERLLDALVSRSGRRELESLGYDVSQAGRRVAEVGIA